MRDIIFTDSAPRRLAGWAAAIVDAQPTMEELVQATVALGCDMPTLADLVKTNQAVNMTWTIFLAVRRGGRHITFKDALALVPDRDFAVMTSGDDGPPAEEEEDVDPPGARTQTGTASVPDGSGRHAAESSPRP